MMRLRLRVMTAGFNEAVAAYTLARLEITSAHPRIAAPPVIHRLGANAPRDPSRVWRATIGQVRTADTYARTGASAVARRDPAWARLVSSFAALRAYAAQIEALRTAVAGSRHRRGS
jgi:hypothetical protein